MIANGNSAYEWKTIDNRNINMKNQIIKLKTQILVISLTGI